MAHPRVASAASLLAGVLLIAACSSSGDASDEPQPGGDTVISTGGEAPTSTGSDDGDGAAAVSAESSCVVSLAGQTNAGVSVDQSLTTGDYLAESRYWLDEEEDAPFGLLDVACSFDGPSLLVSASSDVDERDVAFGPGTYAVGGDESPFSVLVSVDEGQWAPQAGELVIERWDQTGVALTFAFEGVPLLASPTGDDQTIQVDGAIVIECPTPDLGQCQD